MASAAASALPHRSAPFKSPALPTSNAPQGTFLPGTKVQVGSQRVTIEKYLSEGGFAHVYVVRVPREGQRYELAVLKRVAVPDREHLANMRTEVETMKKLKGHRHVVTYMDSHASQLKGGGYEVFLLMEYCAGGGLIDFMNTRLQHRLTEPEILKIFGDVAEGVACMHYLKPPLLHRDLKVENVLIGKSANSGTPIYKLCDFGSTASPRPAAKTAEEGRLIEEDVQKHTTMQYRSPEMIDVWRKQPIDEKADIWALGVFLYKLCYYTTPFEDVGQMAILNASYKYPSYPNFSDRLKKFIGSMLKEDPKHRPNIYQVIKEACSMRGADVPIKDIYASRTQSEARRNESMPSPEPPMSIGLQKETPKVQVQSIPDIAPMRRGRPIAAAQQTPVATAKPSPSPARGDPFAALDSKNFDERAGAVEELSKRFPSLDEFSIVHEKGDAFPFSQQSPGAAVTPAGGNLNERVTAALADEVFSPPKPSKAAERTKAQSTSQLPSRKASPTKPSTVQGKVREVSQPSALMHQPTPVKPSSYKSTGVGSSPPTSAAQPRFPEISNRPIWRLPDQHRSSSQPRASEKAQGIANTLQPSLPPTRRPGLLDMHRSKSQTATLQAAKSSTSSRPSLEGHRPSQGELSGPEISRTKSAQSRPRPSNYLRDQESSRKRPSMDARRHSSQASPERNVGEREGNIDDDIDYLRKNEDEERKREHRRSSGHGGHKKRSSLASISGGAKSMFAGKFGDAFKKFESSVGTPPLPSEEEPSSPELRGHQYHDGDDDDEPRLLSPIEGSVATQSKHSHSDVESDAIDETEDLPPDMRREMERRKLSQEEKRVAAAAAEYKAKFAEQGAGGTNATIPTGASTIQRRVQSLLDEGRQNPVLQKRTAEGYGRHTESPDMLSHQDTAPAAVTTNKVAPPPLARKPITPAEVSNNPYPKIRQQQSSTDPPAPTFPPAPSASAPPVQQTAALQQPRIVSRPSIPPKSQALRTGGGGSKAPWPPRSDSQQASAPPKPSSGLAALLAKDLEGVPDYPPQASSANDARGDKISDDLMDMNGDTPTSLNVPEDLEADFSKRYPSLSGIEMVETEIRGSGGRTTMREV
ncbi:Ark- serine/threonine protein kinase [Vermiconidia calcicola]|uniref:Ark- serine/threonine protein kinase n=1 Tax=Vermiconidia calcicola TaxID=1690605 RepID=A0ACC3NZR3_9PEZI|nr:Ark- serine/threonine protein kinase [Vermiconidia calcicola]